MAVAIRAKLISPVFSLKQPEAFQIATSLPVPQPATLVGALAYSIAIRLGIGSVEALELAKGITLVARSSLDESYAVVSPVLLRRFRVLDKGFESKEKGERPPIERMTDAAKSGDLDTVKKIIEQELSDALYREYVSPVKLTCTWVLREQLDYDLLRLIQRIGDTESLCTAREVWSASCTKVELSEVKTRYPLPVERMRAVSGSYLIRKMNDERGELRGYIIPCETKVYRTEKGAKFTAYSPSLVTASFEDPVKCYEVEGEIIV